MNPLISVIMPVYNGERFIREAIDSVLNQTYQNFEFIIVNDASVDSTQQIINSYHDKRIVSLNLTWNQGVSNARNMGVDLSKGEFIAFADADDLYDLNRLQTQLDFLTKNPTIDVCGSYFVVLENSQEILIKHPLTDQEIKEHFFTENCIGQPSVMGKSGVFKKFRYNSTIKVSGDYDLWTRMATGGVVFANVPHPLMKYRLHPAQISKTKSTLLHITSKTICANYSLTYLNNNIISEYSKAEEISLADFRKFIVELSVTCDKKSRDINTFRPLIALQYKKLDTLGIISFATLKVISYKYHLDFPANYLLNIFLLSFIPIEKNSSLFDTLTKLKLKVPIIPSKS
ncbi:MAG: glycosyltransferase family 2 protein [Smithellaceae bacterium]